MSTPRTITASEVRKGMRVRVERERGKAIVTVEGPADHDFSLGAWPIAIDSQPVNVDPDHPVTVLADPEPEWVEGAWYWTTVEGAPPALRYRVDDGWAAKGSQSDRVIWRDDQDSITVIGRVLIVDWPGDDVATGLIGCGFGGSMMNKAIADAIRTQGGVR